MIYKKIEDVEYITLEPEDLERYQSVLATKGPMDIVNFNPVLENPKIWIGVTKVGDLGETSEMPRTSPV